MRTSDTHADYAVSEPEDRELNPGLGVTHGATFDSSSSDPYADAELKLRSERTEEMIRRAEGYAR